MTTQSASAQDWARLRFAIVGPLLASPPRTGMLQAELDRLANKDYLHPGTGRPVRFAASTLERWYYKARNHPENPLRALVRKVPEHAGTHPSLSSALQQALRAQHQAHPGWSYQLHYDNILALAQNKPELGRVPSRATVVRYMKQSGLDKQRRQRRNRDTREVAREKRSYEIEHVHGLWHSDFHQGPRHVLTQVSMSTKIDGGVCRRSDGRGRDTLPRWTWQREVSGQKGMSSSRQLMAAEPGGRRGGLCSR